jgi:hypothetical protein
LYYETILCESPASLQTYEVRFEARRCLHKLSNDTFDPKYPSDQESRITWLEIRIK